MFNRFTPAPRPPKCSRFPKSPPPLSLSLTHTQTSLSQNLRTSSLSLSLSLSVSHTHTRTHQAAIRQHQPIKKVERQWCLRMNFEDLREAGGIAMVMQAKCVYEGDEASESKEWKIRASDFVLNSETQPLNTQHEKLGAFVGFSYCPTPICKGKNSRLESYYSKQNEILKEMKDLDELLEANLEFPSTQRNDTDRDGATRKALFAIRISNYANMVLFAVKVFISIKSLSFAIIASTLDSLLDLLSGFILWYTSHKMRRPNPYLYPIGKNRMQPVAILVFASIMATLGLQILIESARQLISKDSHLALQGTNKYWVIGVMLSVTFVKFNLMLLCRALKNNIVRAYAKDHLFDVITNTIGLGAALLAERFYWWIDPLGAILLAIYTIWNWGKTVLENVGALVGETAPPNFLQKITYLCWNHHKDIQHIDTIKAYNLGGLYFAEVDIVLPADMPLLLAHDIGESLQNKLECLPDIERAFVHLDYEFRHRPEHASKKAF